MNTSLAILPLVPTFSALKKALALAVGVLVIASPTATAQEVKVYSGTGSAILGTGMTIEETERLALDAARRDALQKFGSYVRSEEILRQASGDDGDVTETFTSETKVISGSVVSLVDDSKTVERSAEGETLRFTASAKFEIDVDRFNERVDRYQNAPEDSELRDLVDRSVRLESRLQEAEEFEKRQRLQSQSLDLRNQIDQSMQRLNGSRVQLSIEQQRNRKKRTLKKHARHVRKNGYPYSLIEIVPRSEPEITDRGDRIEVTADYEIRHESLRQTKTLGKSLRTFTEDWHGKENSPANPYALEPRYFLAWVGTDQAGNIVYLEFGGGTGPCSIELDYTPEENPFPIGMPQEDKYSRPGERSNAEVIKECFFNSWVPYELFDQVKNINLVVTRFRDKDDVINVVEEENLELTGPPKLVVSSGEPSVHVDNIILDESTFKRQMEKLFETK